MPMMTAYALGCGAPATKLEAVGGGDGGVAVVVAGVDVELGKRACELRRAFTAFRLFGVDAEDAGLVAVERDGTAVLLEVTAGRLEVVEGRLGLDEQEPHQATGRVVDVDEQDAARSPVLEPLVVASVDLN